MTKIDINDPFETPAEALELLRAMAFRKTSTGQIARTFLFWLTGQQAPYGNIGVGALDLRHLDIHHRMAALKVLNWWWSEEPVNDKAVHNILEQLSTHFASRSDNEA